MQFCPFLHYFLMRSELRLEGTFTCFQIINASTSLPSTHTRARARPVVNILFKPTTCLTLYNSEQCCCQETRSGSKPQSAAGEATTIGTLIKRNPVYASPRLAHKISGVCPANDKLLLLSPVGPLTAGYRINCREVRICVHGRHVSAPQSRTLRRCRYSHRILMNVNCPFF